MTTLALRKYVRNIIKEVITEGDIKPVKHDSLDEQVDAYIIEYESSARKKNEAFTKKRALVEENDDSNKPQKSHASDIDMDAFVSNVRRLIENATTLLEFEETIIARVRNFIADKYELEAVQNFENALDANGFSVGKSKHDRELDVPQPTYGRAGPIE